MTVIHKLTGRKTVADVAGLRDAGFGKEDPDREGSANRCK